MTTLRRTAAPTLLLLLALLAPLPSAATDVSPHQQLSSNVVEDGDPRVAGDRVAWQRNPDATGEIVRWTPGTGTDDVTSNSFRDFDLELSGTFLIWKRSLDGVTCSLQAKEGEQTPEQIVSTFTCSDAISTAGPHIGWIDDGAGFEDDVFVSTNLADPDQLGVEDVDDAFVRVGNVSGSPRAVWIDEDDVVYWNGTQERALRAEPGSDDLRRQLRMHGQRAVWVDEVGGDTEIFYFDGTAVTQLTSNGFDDETPAIHGTDVVWVGFPDGSATGEIFHYDGTTTEPLTDDDLDDFAPQISAGPDGPTIVWVKTQGDDEIWMFDGCESTQITDNSPDDHSPAIDGNRIAWVRGTGSSAEIFTAVAECDLICGDGIEFGDEECDDGDTESCDGCSAICQLEECGNSRVDCNEECDEGDTTPLDGCDANCLFECGNNTVEGDEDCDVGDRDNGDGCDENCKSEICGNGITQINEDCDDGNTVNEDGCSDACDIEPPAPLPIQRCIGKMNERGAAVAKAQHQVNVLCLSAAAKGTLPALGVPTAQQCLTDDPKGKVLKATTKTTSVDAAKCASLSPLPNFAYTNGATVNAAGVAQPVGLVEDLFGPDLDAVAILAATDKAGARCQKNVLTATQGLADRLFKAALKEKKIVIAGKPGGPTARSNDVLQAHLTEFLLDDAAGKIAGQETAVRSAVRTSCSLPGLDAAFPGCAPSATFNELASCAIGNARCRFCTAFNAYDGLAIDCDAFDDDLANASCP